MREANIKAFSLTSSIILHFLLGVSLSILCFPEIKKIPQLIEVDFLSSGTLNINKNIPASIPNQNQKAEELGKGGSSVSSDKQAGVKAEKETKSFSSLLKDGIAKATKSLENQISAIKEKLEKSGGTVGSGQLSTSPGSGSGGTAKWGGDKIQMASVITPGTPRAEKGKGYTVVGFGTVKAKPEKAVIYIEFKRGKSKVYLEKLNPYLLTTNKIGVLETLIKAHLIKNKYNASTFKVKTVSNVEKEQDFFGDTGVVQQSTTATSPQTNINVNVNSKDTSKEKDPSEVELGGGTKTQTNDEKKFKRVFKHQVLDLAGSYEDKEDIREDKAQVSDMDLKEKAMDSVIFNDELIAVEITDLNLVIPILDYVTSLGVDLKKINGNPIAYEFNQNELNNLKIQAKKIAYDDAKKKAEELVETLGLTIKDTAPSVRERYIFTDDSVKSYIELIF